MTAIRLALTELRRLTSGTLPKLALAAMIVIPTLYGGLYLYANKDPYGNLDQVPAALVVEDRGATLSNGEHLEVGPRVAHDLKKAGTFEWHEVSRAEAERGVEEERYDFALIVPEDFSADLASSADFRPRRAQLQVTTNDANNYLSRTIAGTLVDEVTRSVAEQVSRTAANEMLMGFSTIHERTATAVKGAHDLRQGADKLHRGAADLARGTGKLEKGTGELVTGERKLVTGASDLSAGADKAAGGARSLRDGASTLATGLDTLDRNTTSLPEDTRKLAAGARQVADGNRKIADEADKVADASNELVGQLDSLRGELADRLRDRGFTEDQVSVVISETKKLTVPVKQANAKVQDTRQKLDDLADGADAVAAGADKLAKAAGPLHRGIHSASVGAGKLQTGANDLARGLSTLKTGADDLEKGTRSALTAAQKLHRGAGDLDQGANKLRDGSSSLATGAKKLHEGLRSGLKQIPDPSASARKAVAQTIGAPVTVKENSQATAGSYGAGLAPFFLSIAMWVGAYVLFLLVGPYSTRALAAGQPAWRTALGGWLPPALIGVAQCVLVYAVVLLWLGIDAAHPWGLLAMMFLTSMTFVAILHALAARLGAVGKFLGLVLLVLQLASAGGTFPWQTLPGPLIVLHHILPMGYAVDALRHLMYGGPLTSVGLDAAVLIAYLVLAFVAASLATARARTWTAARIRPELVL